MSSVSTSSLRVSLHISRAHPNGAELLLTCRHLSSRPRPLSNELICSRDSQSTRGDCHRLRLALTAALVLSTNMRRDVSKSGVLIRLCMPREREQFLAVGALGRSAPTADISPYKRPRKAGPQTANPLALPHLSTPYPAAISSVTRCTCAGSKTAMTLVSSPLILWVSIRPDDATTAARCRCPRFSPANFWHAGKSILLGLPFLFQTALTAPA